MATVEHGELQVVVPVGFLLTETQEVTVSVDRPGGEPLPVRLRLIPARPSESLNSADDRPCVSTPTPLAMTWPNRKVFDEEIYGEPEYGGGD